MTQQSLYDLSPLIPLLAMGALLAALPVAWVWSRSRGDSLARRRQALTVLTLFLTLDLILVGAFTRLTDSGLGCPDWPGCYGQATPMQAGAHIQRAQEAMPTGPVTHQKAWIEMLHRYLATTVGALTVVMTWLAWRDRSHSLGVGNATVGVQTQPHAPSPWWPTWTLVWISLQGAFGALTVTMKLFPAIVSLHLLGAYVLLGMLVIQAVQWSRYTGAAQLEAPPKAVQRRLQVTMALGLVLLVVQASSGAWVSTNYAVLACNEFPMCQGSWWPDMDFAAASEIWRPLGERADGSIIGFPALTAIHVTHRVLAMVTIVVLAGLAWRMRGVPLLQRPANTLLGLLALQFLTGLSNVVLGWPLLAAMLHTGGAGALIAVLVWGLALLDSRGHAMPVAVAGVHA